MLVARRLGGGTLCSITPPDKNRHTETRGDGQGWANRLTGNERVHDACNLLRKNRIHVVL